MGLLKRRAAGSLMMLPYVPFIMRKLQRQTNHQQRRRKAPLTAVLQPFSPVFISSFRWGIEKMPTAEQHALIQKAEEYERKAQEELDLFTKKALEAVAREYPRRAEHAQILRSWTPRRSVQIPIEWR
jgi:hypothetical protein